MLRTGGTQIIKWTAEGAGKGVRIAPGTAEKAVKALEKALDRKTEYIAT